MSDEVFLLMTSKMRVVTDLGKVVDDYATNKLMLIRIVLLSWERKAADPRDHFHTIIGIMKDPHNGAPLGPAPDYRLDPEQLFREQTLSLMLQSDSIGLLDQAIGIDAPNALGLPSWVCDWSRFRMVGWKSSLCNASNGRKHQFQPTTEGTFIIAGTMVGVVAKLGSLVNPDDVEDVAIKFEQWQHLAGPGQAFDIRTALRATFLDMVFSGLGESRRLTPDDIAQVEKW